MTPSPFAIVPLIACIVSMHLLVYVRAQHRRSRINRSFILFATLVTLTTGVEGLTYTGLFPTLSIVFCSIGAASFFLFGFAYVEFSYALGDCRRDWAHRMSFVIAVVCAAWSLYRMPFVLVEGGDGLGSIIAPNGTFIWLFVSAGQLPGALALWKLFGYLRSPRRGQHTATIRLVLAGAVFSIIFATVILVVLPVSGYTGLVRVSSIGIILQMIAVYIAVRRYQFMSVNVEQLEEVSKRLLENVRDSAVLMDSRGYALAMNASARGILGDPGDTPLAQHLSAVIDGYEFDKVMNHTRTRLRRGDSTARAVVVTQTYVFESVSSNGRLLLIRDITDELAAEIEQTRVRQLESLGVLAAGIAHDFNNSLAGIVSCFSLLRTAGTLTAEQYETVVMGERAAMEARKLTGQLLTFAKGGEPVEETFDLRPLVNDTVRFALRGSSSRARFDMPATALTVRADRGQISQLIQNLVLNAFQAKPGGEITVRGGTVSLAIDSKLPLDQGAYVFLTVSDVGHGISSDILTRIFDPYFTTKPDGNGLGLTTAYSIARKHGGHISVDSVVGQGATFTVYLPLAPAAAEPQAQSGTPVLTAGGRILVMDDEPVVRLLLGKLLRRLGFEVDAAADGAEALACCERRAAVEAQPYAVAIVDLTVPAGMGGLELTRKLHEKYSRLPVIVASGYSDDPAVAQYRTHGFAGALSKPFTVEALRDTLSQVLDGGHTPA